MSEYTQGWLTEKAICTDMRAGTDNEIIDGLLALLENSGKVCDAARLKEDILKRESIASTASDDGTFLPHALSPGVREFCAAVSIIEQRRICILIAMPEHTPHSLRLFAALIDMLKNAKVRQALLELKHPASIKKVMELSLRSYGVKC